MKDKLVWQCQNALEEAGIIRCHEGASVATVKFGMAAVEFVYPSAVNAHLAPYHSGPDWNRNKTLKMALLRFVQATRSLLQGADVYKAYDDVYSPSYGTETKSILFNHDVFCTNEKQPHYMDVSDVTMGFKEENIGP